MSADDSHVPPGYADGIFELTGRVAVVTGGGSGLGQAIAIGFGQRGVTVIVADLNLPGAEATRATIAEQGGSAAAVWLRCFRGIDTLTAMLILAELHDFRRFQSAPALMSYLGLVPSEDSSADKHRRGRITKTGNTLVRRLLVEAAWHYQHRPGVGVGLARRRHGQPGRVIAIADKAQQRLCRRFRKLAAEHKPPPKIAVAIARELAGFLWAALQPVPASAH